MTHEKICVALREKLNQNHSEMVTGWLKMAPADLIGHAEEIAATELIFDLLPDTVLPEDREHLLRLDNPLEAVRDQWLEENGSDMVHDEDVSHAIWSVIDHGEPAQRGPELC